jgi:YhcH/YjgK/YiaL family protein
MIIDNFTNLHRYVQLPHLSLIQKFITEFNIDKIIADEILLKERLLIVKIARRPAVAADACLEIHKTYTDLHLIIRGSETFNLSLDTTIESISKYNRKSDTQFIRGKTNNFSIKLCPYQFAVFFPGQAHCAVLSSDDIIKLIFKIQ